MGFKMKGSPIKVDGAIVKFFKGTSRESSAETQSRRRAAGNFTKAELTATKKDFTKDANFGVSPKVLPKTSQQNFDKLMTLPNAVTQPITPKPKPTQTAPKKRKKIKTLDTKITPKKTNTDTKATAKTITKKETASKPGKLRSQKNIRNRKLSNKEGSMTRRERRLMKTLDKASSAKAKTNQTVGSIDTSKPKSADTGAKQTSARRSRAKAKRLENRASRIEGRIERKASRQAQRKKIKENR